MPEFLKWKGNGSHLLEINLARNPFLRLDNVSLF